MKKLAWGVLLLLVMAPLTGAFAAGEHLNRASELYKAGKLEEAVTEYNKALEANPENAAAYLGIAAAYRDLGKTSQAIKHLEKAASLDPKNWLPYFSQAMIYVGLKDYKSADKMFEEARRRAPGNKKVLVTQALARMQSGDASGALAILEKARKLYPDDPYVAADTGLAMIRAGRQKEGLKLLRDAAKKWPESDWVSQALQQGLYEREEKIWSALPEDAERLEKLASAGGQLRAALAKIKLGARQLKDGHAARALRILKAVMGEKRVLSSGRRGEVMTLAGKASLKLGENANAEKLIAEAVVLCPKDPFVRYEYAACLALSDKAKALENLKKALELAATTDQRSAIRRRAISEKAFEKLKRDKTFVKIVGKTTVPKK